MSRILVIGGYGAFRSAGIGAACGRARPGGHRRRAQGGRGGRIRGTACARGTCEDHSTPPSTRQERRRSRSASFLSPCSSTLPAPFRAELYSLARAVHVRAGCHYVDLADARAFVTGITQIDREARAAGVSVISGASSVPGLSSAVVEAYVGELATLDAVDIGISPGNGFDPGMVIIVSILGAVGRPFNVLVWRWRRTVLRLAGAAPSSLPRARRALDEQRRGAGPRPPARRHPGRNTARFSAGVEVGMFDLAPAGGCRASCAPASSAIRGRLAAPLLGAKRRLRFLGGDAGGMFVALHGRDAQGEPRSIDWTLIARSGDGPYVPATASAILAETASRRRRPAARSATVLCALHARRFRRRGLGPRHYVQRSAPIAQTHASVVLAVAVLVLVRAARAHRVAGGLAPGRRVLGIDGVRLPARLQGRAPLGAGRGRPPPQWPRRRAPARHSPRRGRCDAPPSAAARPAAAPAAPRAAPAPRA